MLLTDEELYEVTHKYRTAARVRVLRAMGIEHRVRPDNTIAVSRAHVENLLGGGDGAKVKEITPNWNSFAKAT